MTRWQWSRFGQTVAVMCMALAALLSAQAFIRLMDRIEHDSHHAHFANPLAGSVIISHAGEAAHHHHHHGTDTGAADRSQGAQTADDHRHSHAPAHSHPENSMDHQHGDASVLFLAAQSFVLVGCPLTSLRSELRPEVFVSFAPRGPDHPPKPVPEHRA